MESIILLHLFCLTQTTITTSTKLNRCNNHWKLQHSIWVLEQDRWWTGHQRRSIPRLWYSQRQQRERESLFDVSRELQDSYRKVRVVTICLIIFLVMISFFISVEFYNIKTEYMISATWISIERSTFGYIKAKTLIGFEYSRSLNAYCSYLTWFSSILWRNDDDVTFNDHTQYYHKWRRVQECVDSSLWRRNHHSVHLLQK